MKSIIILIIVACSAQALSINEKWDSFKEVFNKKYSGVDEETVRKKIYLANVDRMKKHNEKYQQGLVSYKIGINKFTDFTREELRNYSNGLKVPSRINDNLATFKPRKKFDFPDNVDWRDQGVVSPVKDQGDCGSCWAFAATGALEFHYGIYDNLTVSLSEQNLIDCVYDSSGCQGGWTEYAFLYIKHNLGENTESDYPYEVKDGTCRFDRKKVHYNVTGIVYIEAGNEADLQAAVVEKGPVSVAINTFGDFYNYQSGVYYSDSCDNDILNHAMVVVGYGTEDGQDYWLVKNSFSKDWGDNGYIKMARNRDNNCGIADRALFPLI